MHAEIPTAPHHMAKVSLAERGILPTVSLDNLALRRCVAMRIELVYRCVALCGATVINKTIKYYCNIIPVYKEKCGKGTNYLHITKRCL